MSDTRISWKYCERMGKRLFLFCFRGEETWAPERWRTDGRGGGHFLFDTSDLQMLLKWHDFPVFFLKFTVGRNICLFRSLHVRACRTAGLGGSSPPPPIFFFGKSMLQRKRKKERERKVTCQCHKWGIKICSSDRNSMPKTPELTGLRPRTPPRALRRSPGCSSDRN